MTTSPTDLQRTALYDLHVSLGARMVPFAGWEMPLQYTGILAEARAVRTSLGLFDVSHMGRLRFGGPNAAAFLDRVLPARVEALQPGRARYTFVLNEEGGIIDDCIVSRLGAPDAGRGEEWLLVVNAANRVTVKEWLTRWLGEHAGVTMRDTTLETVMIAVQGPGAATVMDGLLHQPQAPTTLRLFSLADGEMALDPGNPGAATPVMVSRTGYTGEDGFEIFADAAAGQAIWRLLLDRGAASCGLGARDTLRLEAGLALHGNDIDAATTPLEAGLDRFVPLDQDGDFFGKEALLRQRDGGLRRRLVGFTMQEKALPRHGYAILAGGRQIGTVTSGGYSPTLDRGIGMGYVPVEHEAPGTALEIDLRGRPSPAQVVPLPFYKRP